MKFEIHGDETGIVVTTDQCVYELKARYEASFSVDRERDDYRLGGYREWFAPPRDVLTLRMELDSYRVIVESEAPMIYGEGVWMH